MLFITIVIRELKIAFRNISSIINPLLFFIIAISLFPLAISPEASILSEMAAGLIWVATLLSVLLSLNLMFVDDYDNAILEQMLIAKKPIITIVMAKIFTHWLLTGVPIILLTPLFGTMLFINSNALYVLIITLIISTPTLSLIGAIGAAMVVGIKNSQMLLALIILPFYIPILIFAAGAVSNVDSGLSIAGNLYFLITILLISLMLAPVASSFAIKINLE